MEKERKMKIFINKRVGYYSGGMAIVAAETSQEAHDLLLNKFPDMCYMIDKDGYNCSDKDECVEIKNYYYKKENWIELPNVIADYPTSVFIDESGRSE